MEETSSTAPAAGSGAEGLTARLWCSRYSIAAVVLGLAAFFETRLWLVARFPYFLDEGILGLYAQEGQNADQRLISLTEGVRPGLVWMTLGGMSLHISTLVSIRLSVVIFGLVVTACGTILSLRYADRTAAIAFGVLALFTPFLFLYESLGLRDPVIAGLMVSGLLLELELARRPRLWVGLLLGVTFGLDFLVKESGQAALVLLPLSLLYFPVRSPQRLRLGAAWVGNVVLALVMAWLATLTMKLSSAYANLGLVEREVGVKRSFGDVAAHPLRYFDESWHGVHQELTSYLTWPVIVLAVAGLGLGLWRRTRLTIVVAAWALAQLGAAIWLAGNVYARYVVPAIPFVLMLAAIGVTEIVTLVRERLGDTRRVSLSAIAIGALLLIPALIFDAQASYDPAAAGYPPGDKVAFVTGWPSGFGTPQVVDELAIFSTGRPLTVIADPNLEPFQVLVLAASRGLDINWVSPNDSEARTADAFLSEGNPVPAGVGRFREVWSYERPDNGTPIALYVRP
ncbi:MAG TPA: hypothetical protein VG265_09570 [Gaiellaceae bacterium]|nr:hypothetical protein [Gaiellaceae bacterium]